MQIMKKKGARPKELNNNIEKMSKQETTIKKTMSIGVDRSYSLEVEAMTMKELLQLLAMVQN